jgi:hypothetical protein
LAHGLNKKDYTVNIPSIPVARRFAADVAALGGTFPAPLSSLIVLVDSVKSVPATPNPAASLVDAAASGKASTASQITKLIADAARAESEAAYAQRLRGSVEKHAMRRFALELRAGAAEAIITSLRPQFDATAQQIAELRESVDVGWSIERLISEGTPEQLAAWQQLPALVAKVDRFAALVAGFGRQGDCAVLDEPEAQGVSHEIAGVRDEALFVTSADVWQASDIIRARLADWRSSPWLRIPLRLNSVDEARERLRRCCEAAWDAVETSRGIRGQMSPDGWKQDPRRANPFSLVGSDAPEPAAPVDVKQPDPAEAVDADTLDLAAIVGAPEDDEESTATRPKTTERKGIPE